ncbi:unnamed protein product, partial [Musa hybrid cultivar]
NPTKSGRQTLVWHWPLHRGSGKSSGGIWLLSCYARRGERKRSRQGKAEHGKRRSHRLAKWLRLGEPISPTSLCHGRRWGRRGMMDRLFHGAEISPACTRRGYHI